MQLRHLALSAAIEASKAIMDIYHQPFDTDTKSDGSPVTLADIRANSIIERILKPSGLPVFSEESKHEEYAVRRHWESFWLVDPLDGTKEFISKNGEFTVNIALIFRGQPVMGVITAPALGQAWSGSLDEGIFTHDNIMLKTASLPESGKPYPEADTHIQPDFEKVTGVKAPEDQPSPATKANNFVTTTHSYRIVISRSHGDKTTQTVIGNIRKKFPSITTVPKGSSLKLCEVAIGRADIYPRYAPTHEWDIAAGHALIAAGGGQVIDAHTGKTLQYNKPDILNPAFIAARRDIPPELLEEFLL